MSMSTGTGLTMTSSLASPHRGSSSKIIIKTHQQKLQSYFGSPPPPPQRNRSLSPPKPIPVTLRQGRQRQRVPSGRHYQQHQHPKQRSTEEHVAPEVAISFEQVEPKTYRVVGGSTTVSGPVPATNRVACRPLRRTFPQLVKSGQASAQSPSSPGARKRTGKFYFYQNIL